MLPQLGVPPSAVRSHEELFAYWASLRDGARLPARRQLDPRAFKRHLPTVSLIDVTEGRRFRQRLAGTGLYPVYGREITGKALEDVYAADAAAYWRRELEKVVDERRPGVGLHSMSWRGGSHLSLHWLRLPLSRDGKRIDMILGYDAVLGSNAERYISGIRAA
jgi:hypothetical protein